MADHENPPAISFLNQHPAPCCCTNQPGRATCTNPTGNHCQSTRATNYHSLTARISGLPSKCLENFNDHSVHHERSAGRHLRGFTRYCLDDYLVNSQEKENSSSVLPSTPSVSPVLSPETVDVLQNAERLVKDAQRQIMEVSYKTHLSPTQNNGAGSTSRPPLDDNLLYLRELVAAKFHEANTLNRNFKKIPSVSLVDVQPKELSKLQDDQIPVKESQSFLNKKYELQSDKHSESSTGMKYKKSMAKEENNFFKRFQADCTTSADAFLATTLPPRHQTETGVSTDSRNPQDWNTGVFRMNEGDQRSRIKFQIQKGPQVDIQRGLTIQSVDNIHISPDASAVPVYKNVATYEFQHETMGSNKLKECKIPSAKFIDIHQQPSSSSSSSSRIKDSDVEIIRGKQLDEVDEEEHVEAVKVPEENIISNPPMERRAAAVSEEIEIAQMEVMESHLKVNESKAANDDLATNVSQQFDNGEIADKPNEKDEALINGIKFEVSKKNPLQDEEFQLDNINLQAPRTVDLDRILQVYSNSIDHIVRGTQKLSQLLERRTTLEISDNQSKLYSNENYILPPSTGTLMTSVNLANPMSQLKYPKTTMNVECVKNSFYKDNIVDRYVETCAVQNPSRRCTAIIRRNVTENINESCQAIANSDCDQGPLDVTPNKNFVLTVRDSTKPNGNTKSWSLPIVISSNEKSLVTSTRNDIHLESSESTQYVKYDITSEEEEDKLESRDTLEKFVLIKEDREKAAENLSEFSTRLDKLLHADNNFRRELKSNTGSSFNIHSNENPEFQTGASSLLTSFRKPDGQDKNANAKNELVCTPEGGIDEDDQVHMVKTVLEALRHSSKAMEEFLTWLLDKRESNISQDVTSILQKATISPLIMDRFLSAIRKENPSTNVFSEERITNNELHLTLSDWRKIYDLAKYFSQISDKSEANLSGNAREPNVRRDLSSCGENESYIKVSVENEKDSENLSAMKRLNEERSNASMINIDRKNITENKVDFDSKLIEKNYENYSEKSASSQRTKSELQDKRIDEESRIKKIKQESVTAKNDIQKRTKRSSDTTNDTSLKQSKKGVQQNDSRKSLVSRCIRKKCPSIPSESATEKKMKAAANVGTQVESSREEKSTFCNNKSSLAKDNTSKTTEASITYSSSTSAETISDFTHDYVPCKTESRIDSKSSKDRSQEHKKVKDTAEKSTGSQPIQYLDKSTSFSLKRVDNEKKKIDTYCETEQSSRVQDKAVEVQEEDKDPIKNTAKSVSFECAFDQSMCCAETPMEIKSSVKSITRDSYKTKAKPDEGDALVKSSGVRSKGSDYLEARGSESSPEDKDDCQKNCSRDEKCKIFCNDDDDYGTKKRSKQPTIVSSEKSYQPCCKSLKSSNNSYFDKDQPNKRIVSTKQERPKRLSWKEIESKDEKAVKPNEKMSIAPKVSDDIQENDSELFQCSKDCTNDETCMFVCPPFHMSSLVDDHSVPPDPDDKRSRSSVVSRSKQEEERKLMTELRDAQENIKAEQDKARKARAKLSDLKKHRISHEEQYSRDASMKENEECKESFASQDKNPSELTVIFARMEDEHENQSMIQAISSPSQESEDLPIEQERRSIMPINYISPSFDTPRNIYNNEGEQHVQYEDNKGVLLGARSSRKRLTASKDIHNPSIGHLSERRRKIIEAEYLKTSLSNLDNENSEIKAKEWPSKKKPFTTVSISENIPKSLDKTQRGMDANVRVALVSTDKSLGKMKKLENLFECCTLEEDLKVQGGSFRTSYKPDKGMEGCKFHESLSKTTVKFISCVLRSKYFLEYNEILQDTVYKSISDEIHERDYSVTEQALCTKPEIIDHFLGRRKLEDINIERNKGKFSCENLDALDQCSSLYIDSTYRRSNVFDHLKLSMVSTNADKFLTPKNLKEIHFENICGYPLELNEPSSATCSEGELYMPSSCSYSFGEVRVSSKSRPGGKVFNRADGMTIFVTSSALPSSNEPSLGSDSLGEIRKIDLDLLESSTDVTSDSEKVKSMGPKVHKIS